MTYNTAEVCPDCNSPLPASNICAVCATAIAGVNERVMPVAGAPAIEGYAIRRLLGEGGMGAVYLADDLTLGRKVAIKVIRSAVGAGQLSERFVREARTMATIEDPNVVRLYTYGTTGDASYLVMEYVPGESLAELIRRRGPLSIAEVCRIGIQACYGLRSAAAKGIVHRDVKPGNILIDERQTVRVADFGLAKQTVERERGDALTVEGLVVGTPHYMPPEQAEGRELTSASDVYSLGLVLYELLTGSRAFSGDTPLAVLAKQMHEPLPKIRRKGLVPYFLVKLLKSMTSKKPEQRPTFDQVIAGLEKTELWTTGAEQQIGWGQVLLVALYVCGLFTASMIGAELAEKVGIVKPLLLGTSAAVFGFAAALTFAARRSWLPAAGKK